MIKSVSKMKYLKYILLFLIGFAVNFDANSDLTANQIIDKCQTKFNTSKGISATYTIVGRNISKQSGTIKMQGNKFTISHPSITTWYDGKSQWNYNSDSDEVTISSPSSSEIEMINPYAIVKNYKANYTATLSKSKIKGTYCIVLNAKSTKNQIKKIYLYVKSTDYVPARLDIVSDNNSLSTIVITNYKSGQNFPSSDFVFPSKKYKSATIIDLR